MKNETAIRKKFKSIADSVSTETFEKLARFFWQNDEDTNLLVGFSTEEENEIVEYRDDYELIWSDGTKSDTRPYGDSENILDIIASCATRAGAAMTRSTEEMIKREQEAQPYRTRLMDITAPLLTHQELAAFSSEVCKMPMGMCKVLIRLLDK